METNNALAHAVKRIVPEKSSFQGDVTHETICHDEFSRNAISGNKLRVSDLKSNPRELLSKVVKISVHYHTSERFRRVAKLGQIMHSIKEFDVALN